MQMPLCLLWIIASRKVNNLYTRLILLQELQKFVPRAHLSRSRENSVCKRLCIIAIRAFERRYQGIIVRRIQTDNFPFSVGQKSENHGVLSEFISVPLSDKLLIFLK